MNRAAKHTGSRRLSLATVAVAVLALQGMPTARAGDVAIKHDLWQWSGKATAGGRLEVRGINGSIVATGSLGDQIEVEVDKSGRRDDPRDVRIEVVQKGNHITLCAVYPGRGNACEPGRIRGEVGQNDVTTDFTVKVPAGISFDAATVNGSVRARGLAGSVEATSVNGDCDVESFDTAVATTVNGNIHAVMAKAPKGRFALKTVNGDVSVSLPATLDARIEAQTMSGSIRSEFPGKLSGRYGPKSLSATAGRGTGTVSLSTVNGSIQLEKNSD